MMEKWVADLGDNSTDLLKFWTDMNNEYGCCSYRYPEADHATAANYFANGIHKHDTYVEVTQLSGLRANNEELKGKIGSFPIPGDAAGTMLNAEGYALCSSSLTSRKNDWFPEILHK